MITNFKLYENIATSDEFSKFKEDMNFVVYKGKKRSGNKNTNYKTIKLQNIDIDSNENIINTKKIYSIDVKIIMNNKDNIIANHNRIMELDQMIDNNIQIKINDNITMNMSIESYNLEIFLLNIINEYKKYLEKIWKIK
jgi:hypothetical protein